MKKLLCLALVFALMLTLNLSAFADPLEATEPVAPAVGEATPDLGIKITKHPYSEIDRTVGADVLFLSFAEGYTSFYWQILTGQGIFRADEITETYPKLELEGTDTSRLKIKGVNFDQYGWKFRCVYVNDQGELPSEWAILTVVEPARSTTPACKPCVPCYVLPDPYGGTPLPTSCSPAIIIGG